MRFYIKKTNQISIYYYKKNFAYDDIINTLKLFKDHYNNIERVFKFYDIAISKKKVILKEDKEKKQMILQMERELDFDIMIINIELIEKVLNNEEIFRIITQELNKIKNKDIINENSQRIKDQDNEGKLKQMEEKLIIIQNKSDQQIEEINKIKQQYQKDMNLIKKEVEDIREEIKKIYNGVEINNKLIKNEVNKQKEDIKQLKQIEQNDNNHLIKEIKVIKEQIKKINIIIESNNNYIRKLKEEDPCNLVYK